MVIKNFKNYYGIDTLSVILGLLGLILIRLSFLRFIGILIIVYALYRVFSRDKNKRLQELHKFNNIFNISTLRQFLHSPITELRRKYITFINRINNRKYYVYIKCPKCNKTLRLPRNKGKLKSKCPVCSFVFFKKT